MGRRRILAAAARACLKQSQVKRELRLQRQEEELQKHDRQTGTLCGE